MIRKDQSLDVPLESAQCTSIYCGFSDINRHSTDGAKIPFHSSAKKRTWKHGSRDVDNSNTQIFVNVWPDDWAIMPASSFEASGFISIVHLVEANWTAVVRVAAAIQRRKPTVEGANNSLPLIYERIKGSTA